MSHDHDHHTPSLPGDPLSTKSRVLETGASMVQDFAPVKNICAHLNAFHVYASDKTRCVEANHYCSHITEEYMITPKLYDTLPPEERKLWHTHEFEVKSGMLVMPAPAGVPAALWEKAETAEMQDIIPLYGKTYHFWQVDRGDAVPMGAPQLMASFTSEERVKVAREGGMEELCKGRDERFGVDWRDKKRVRAGLRGVEGGLHPDADAMWEE